MQSKTGQPKLEHTIVPGNLKLAFRLSEDSDGIFCACTSTAGKRCVRCHTPGLWNPVCSHWLGAGEPGLCGAPRPQQTEPCDCCKQDLQGLPGQQKEPLPVHEVNTDTISQPHNKHLCSMEKVGVRDGGVMAKERKGVTHLYSCNYYF